jgi:uncharacterized protein YbjT (DUF2867 family)
MPENQKVSEHRQVNSPTTQPVLVTGATGYVGGRLVPRLLEQGYAVRVLVRDPARLQGRQWIDQVEVFQGDVLKPETLNEALQGVSVAYYLIHSMMAGADFHQRDQQAAEAFATAARYGGARKIVYLGGLGDPEAELSNHLRSRQDTGIALRSSGVPVIEFRAGVIVGAGSASFEMIRYLTERVPIMISPRWVYTRTQPISIDNVLDYLVAAIELEQADDLVLEIGGPKILTYENMLRGYAATRGLIRFIIPVPVLTPRLSSYWVHWVTPIPAALARPLIEGLRNEVIVRNHHARELFPSIQLSSYEKAVEVALTSLHARDVESSWSDALASTLGDAQPVHLSIQEGMIVERRALEVPASTPEVYRAFTKLGGDQGWLYANWAWRLRGVIDRLVGGVGFRRGRRDPNELRVGDALDFWRVEQLLPDEKMLLRAEMKVPGEAWLQYETHTHTAQTSCLMQTAFFAPKGLFGLLYWTILYPIHAHIFSGLIKRVGELAQVVQNEA